MEIYLTKKIIHCHSIDLCIYIFNVYIGKAENNIHEKTAQWQVEEYKLCSQTACSWYLGSASFYDFV